MVQFNVTGMSCAACSAHVEKAVSAVSGVTAVSVSLLTNSMSVDGGDPSDIIKAVENAGYGAALKSEAKPRADGEDALEDKDSPKLLKRLLISIGFLLVLMYISMGASMWGWPLPDFLKDDLVARGMAQMLLAAIIMVINQKFFINGFKGIIRRAPNMDTLVSMGSAAAFGYSIYAMFVMSGAAHAGNSALAESYFHELYFESAGMILTLITLGKLLEARSKGKTTNALKSLIKLAPKTAVVIRDGLEAQIPVEQLRVGDIFAVKAGESIPADGVIIEGETAVNESALTGESIPADKTVGDEVSAATINVSGYIKCRAARVGEDTSLSQIIKMVSDAAATKAPIAKIADKVSGVFVPSVLAIAAVTVFVWLVCGETAGYAIERGISVLVISCPCALGLATPVAIMVGSGVGAKNGILFKTAACLEQTGKTRTMLLDKTGTITGGEPVVTDIIVNEENIGEEDFLKTAFSLEKRSEHPLARAIIKCGKERGFDEKILPEPSKFEVLRGAGISAVLNGDEYVAGNLRLCEVYCDLPRGTRMKAEGFAEQGKTPLFFCKNQKLFGVIAVADEIKPDSARAVSRLKNMGIRTVMLTGDNRQTAEAVAAKAGVDEVVAGVLPGGKEEICAKFSEKGAVSMVGDGINDAPALTRADIGIAIGAGADIAVDAADVVLMKSNLSDAAAAVSLSRSVLRNIKQNLFWAFFYNVLGIPLAAGVYIPLFGWRLNPMFGAAAMSLSSFFVVTNALRLNFIDIYNEKRDRKLKSSNGEKPKNIREVRTMEITMKIEGMMCGHCEATVKKALEAVDGVEEAVVSHLDGTARVKTAREIDFSVLREAVEAKDYKVIE